MRVYLSYTVHGDEIKLISQSVVVCLWSVVPYFLLVRTTDQGLRTTRSKSLQVRRLRQVIEAG
jgi:hypothetical protein